MNRNQLGNLLIVTSVAMLLIGVPMMLVEPPVVDDGRPDDYLICYSEDQCYLVTWSGIPQADGSLFWTPHYDLVNDSGNA